MRQLRAWLSRLVGLFRRNRDEQEFHEELDSNIQLLIDDNLRRGMTPPEARRAARIKFGSMDALKEAVRDRRGVPLFDALRRDLNYAVRLLRKTPVFTTVAILSLVLGIGANATIFGLINAVFLRPLPAQEPHRLVLLSAYFSDGQPGAINFAMIRELERHANLFSDVIRPAGDRPVAVEYNGRAFPGWDYGVSSNFYSSLGIQAALGRVFSPADDAPAGSSPARVAVLSHHYWQTRFDGDPGVVGKTVNIDGRPFTIIGVTGKEFSSLQFGLTQHITTIHGALEMALGERDPRLNAGAYTYVLARLAPQATIEEARAQLTAEFPELLEATVSPTSPNPTRYREQRLTVDSGAQGAAFPATRSGFSRPLYVLMALVGIVLLLACVNLANLLLARAAVRQREFAVRSALGAGRLALVRQVLIESVLLSTLGSAGGLALASRAMPWLAEFAWTGPQGIVIDLSTDFRVLGFLAGVTVVTSIVMGVASAWHSSSVDPARSLQSAARITDFRLARSARGIMVTQIALSLLLVSAAGLFEQSLAGRYVDAPPLIAGLLTAKLYPQRMTDPVPDWSLYTEQLTSALMQRPDVRSVALDMDKFRGDEVTRPGSSIETPSDVKWISGEYFQVRNLQIRRGRSFDIHDNRQSPKVAIVGETLAGRLFPNSDAIGGRINIGDNSEIEVVGIAADPVGLDEPAAQVYLPVYQLEESPTILFDLKILTSGSAAALKPAVDQVVNSLGRHFILRLRTDAEDLAERFWVDRMLAGMATSLATLAVFLFAVGLYGVIAYSVSRRIGEIGIRVAVGATRAGIMRLFLGETGKLVGVGLALGFLGALALGRFVAAFLFNVSATDPSTLAISAAILVGVAVLAASIPAWRAATIDPVRALRKD